MGLRPSKSVFSGLCQSGDRATKLLAIDWFGHVFLKSCCNSTRDIMLCRICSKCHGWDASAPLGRKSTELSNERVAIFQRHRDITDNYIRSEHSQMRSLHHGPSCIESAVPP